MSGSLTMHGCFRHDIPIESLYRERRSLYTKDKTTFNKVLVDLEAEGYKWYDETLPTDCSFQHFPIFINLQPNKYIDLGCNPDHEVIPFIMT